MPEQFAVQLPGELLWMRLLSPCWPGTLACCRWATDEPPSWFSVSQLRVQDCGFRSCLRAVCNEAVVSHDSASHVFLLLRGSVLLGFSGVHGAAECERTIADPLALGAVIESPQSPASKWGRLVSEAPGPLPGFRYLAMAASPLAGSLFPKPQVGPSLNPKLPAPKPRTGLGGKPFRLQSVECPLDQVYCVLSALHCLTRPRTF